MPLRPPVSDLFESLAHHWTNPDARHLFEVAMTRKAWNQESGRKDSPHHEPLEWLGDRVLGAVVAQELWRRFSHADPGPMTRAYSALVSEAPLAEVARRFHLLDAVQMGAGEAQEGQVDREGALSDHVEALVAAAFLSGGWPGAEALIDRLMGDAYPAELPDGDTASDKDVTSRLNEAVQRRWRRNLTKGDWTFEREGGPDHAPIFRCTVVLPDGSVHPGETASSQKRSAKAAAASVALAHILAGQV
ncbi:MAG: hypothetical protein JXX28_02595 [Deltaproteobacteria bacterium]|nr:hypothetical protein [Deltaproteobacteria bacterium]